MPDDLITQAASLLKSAKTAAILLPRLMTLDHLAAAVALQVVLKNNENSASIFSVSDETISLPFLEAQPNVRTGFSKGDQFAVKISSAHAKPGELRYEVVEDGIIVYLKSQQGEFHPEDVSVVPGRKKFDVLISVGVKNLEQLGSLYTDNAAVFFETPHIVIDNNPGNEYFGTVNIVKLTTSSVSEIVMEIIALEPEVLKDSIVSTSLLAGIISQTHSFRDPRTTPATLAQAAKLVEAGARQQDIIQHLFKTKPLPVLQLWGRSLARINTIAEAGALYTSLIASDFQKTHADESVVVDVLRDIVEMVTGFSIVALFAESGQGARFVLAGLPHTNIVSLAQKLGAAVDAAFPLSGKLEYINVLIPDKKITELQEQFIKNLAQ